LAFVPGEAGSDTPRLQGREPALKVATMATRNGVVGPQNVHSLLQGCQTCA